MERIKRVEMAVEALQLPEYAMTHLQGTALICARLAQARGENPELAYIAGLLHDVAACRNGSALNHARLGAAWAEKLLRQLGGFAEAEIRVIHDAIYLHSDKTVVHGPFAQLLKEADVRQKDGRDVPGSKDSWHFSV